MTAAVEVRGTDQDVAEAVGVEIAGGADGEAGTRLPPAGPVMVAPGTAVVPVIPTLFRLMYRTPLVVVARFRQSGTTVDQVDDAGARAGLGAPIKRSSTLATPLTSPASATEKPARSPPFTPAKTTL